MLYSRARLSLLRGLARGGSSSSSSLLRSSSNFSYSSTTTCPIEGLKKWINNFHVKLELCPWAGAALPKTKFIKSDADVSWSDDKVYDLVRKEAEELVTPDKSKRFPANQEATRATMIVFPQLESGKSLSWFHHCYWALRTGVGLPSRGLVHMFCLSPGRTSSFHAPFECFLLVTTEAMDWAVEDYCRTHPGMKKQEVHKHLVANLEKTFDNIYDDMTLADLIDESSWIRTLCLGKLGELKPLELKGFLSEKRKEEMGFRPRDISQLEFTEMKEFKEKFGQFDKGRKDPPKTT